MLPHCRPPLWPAEIPESRFASTISRDPEGCRVGLIGLADDHGVRLNHGRAGAAEGPRAFRAALARYGTSDAAGIVWPRVFDAGDVVGVPGEDLAAMHRRVTQAVAGIVELGLVPVGIGGGHDLTFPFVRAVAAHLSGGGGAQRGDAGDEASSGNRGMVGVYFDAHLDVREAPGSGMAFRRLVEDCGVRSLHVHGLNPVATSQGHLGWFQAHHGHVETSATPDDPWPEGDVFVSLDLDVIDQAHAPGVSAMNPAGWSPALAERWAAAAGREPRVRCFDIMELSPPHDENGRTARLAAHLFLAFLRGFAGRAG
jgi:arginase family enzyme